MLAWRWALTRPASVSHGRSSEGKMLKRPCERPLFYMSGLAEPLRGAERGRGAPGLFKDEEAHLMHESGVQGRPAGCPALVKALRPASWCQAHWFVLWLSEWVNIHNGWSVTEGPSPDTHTHTHSFSNTHPWTSNQHLRERSHLQCRGLYAEKTQVIGGSDTFGGLWQDNVMDVEHFGGQLNVLEFLAVGCERGGSWEKGVWQCATL